MACFITTFHHLRRHLLGRSLNADLASCIGPDILHHMCHHSPDHACYLWTLVFDCRHRSRTWTSRRRTQPEASCTIVAVSAFLIADYSAAAAAAASQRSVSASILERIDYEPAGNADTA